MNSVLGKILAGITGIAVVLAVPFAFLGQTQTVNAASLNNFSITSYDIQYELSKDENNRSKLLTTETITANFATSNQNHGIERALPTGYNGHSTSLNIESVSDANGNMLNYTNLSSNGVMLLRIGDANKYVSGIQTYKIVYSQSDVTRFYEDTNRDEWYWDTNGTEWQVPIESLTISVKIAEGLRGAMVGEPFCYEGVEGSNTNCAITNTGDGEYKALATNLSSGENVTVAFGFEPNTFAAYQPSLWDVLLKVWLVLTLVTGILGFIVFMILAIMYYRKQDRLKELHTIPVQYVPPKHTSMIVAAQVVTASGSAFSAQLIDLAVRHIIQIIETKPAGAWSLAEYDIKMLVDGSSQLEEVQEILSDIWGQLPKAGDRVALKSLRNNTGYAARTLDNDKKVKALIEGSYAVREKSPSVSKYFYRWSVGMLIAGLLTLSIPLLFFAGIVALFGVYIRPLTDKGLELRRYILGLDVYIKTSEVERLKMFQAPDTAQKVGEKVDVNNTGQILKLYERVLPYAILFGREKQWTKQLGDLYSTTQTSPGWYSGTTAFNALVFSSAISSFSTAANYSGGSSSSSGGSSGGGSSGGGGGGGGGGGW